MIRRIFGMGRKNSDRVFGSHAAVEVTLVSIGNGVGVDELLLKPKQVASRFVAFGLAGGETSLQLVDGPIIISTDQQACQFKTVASAELFLSLVLYGLTEQGGLGARFGGQIGQFSIEIAVVVTFQEVVVDVGSFLVLAYDVIGYSHIAV